MNGRKIKWLLLAIPSILALVFGGVYIAAEFESMVADSPQGGAAPAQAASSNKSMSTEEFKAPSTLSAVFEDGDFPKEEEYMNALHKMTHQKVKAIPKWGALQITDETISQMLGVLDRADYEHEAFYRETLEAWEDGDFSNAVHVHNRIWEWQDGTIGKAERLLTPEEEAEFIKHKLK